MKQQNVWLLVLTVLFMLSSTAVFAGPYHGGRHFGGRHFGGDFHGYHSSPRFGFYLGFPMYRPYYSYPYYPSYPPTIITVPSSPPVYIERSVPPVTQQFPSGYWYYCSNPEGYYPYVTECPLGWRQVDPVPPQ